MKFTTYIVNEIRKLLKDATSDAFPASKAFSKNDTLYDTAIAYLNTRLKTYSESRGITPRLQLRDLIGVVSEEDTGLAAIPSSVRLNKLVKYIQQQQAQQRQSTIEIQQIHTPPKVKTLEAYYALEKSLFDDIMRRNGNSPVIAKTKEAIIRQLRERQIYLEQRLEGGIWPHYLISAFNMMLSDTDLKLEAALREVMKTDESGNLAHYAQTIEDAVFQAYDYSFKTGGIDFLTLRCIEEGLLRPVEISSSSSSAMASSSTPSHSQASFFTAPAAQPVPAPSGWINASSSSSSSSAPVAAFRPSTDTMRTRALASLLRTATQTLAPEKQLSEEGLSAMESMSNQASAEQSLQSVLSVADYSQLQALNPEALKQLEEAEIHMGLVDQPKPPAP